MEGYGRVNGPLWKRNGIRTMLKTTGRATGARPRGTNGMRPRAAGGATATRELTARDKSSLDVLWLKGNSLVDLDNLLEPGELAEQIIENLEAGLDSFREVLAALQ